MNPALMTTVMSSDGGSSQEALNQTVNATAQNSAEAAELASTVESLVPVLMAMTVMVVVLDILITNTINSETRDLPQGKSEEDQDTKPGVKILGYRISW